MLTDQCSSWLKAIDRAHTPYQSKKSMVINKIERKKKEGEKEEKTDTETCKEKQGEKEKLFKQEEAKILEKICLRQQKQKKSLSQTWREREQESSDSM